MKKINDIVKDNSNDIQEFKSVTAKETETSFGQFTSVYGGIGKAKKNLE